MTMTMPATVELASRGGAASAMGAMVVGGGWGVRCDDTRAR